MSATRTPLTPAVAIAAARAHRGGRVLCFEHSWPAVDRARDLIDALGLAHCISVHHASALSSFTSGVPCHVR
jgi:hypothetical protein